MLGTQTQGSRMEGIDESTELWWHPTYVIVRSHQAHSLHQRRRADRLEGAGSSRHGGAPDDESHDGQAGRGGKEEALRKD